MVQKEFKYRGKTIAELKTFTLNEFMELIPSRSRRSLQRGFTDDQKILLEKFRQNKKNIKTHSRDMIVIPEMVDHMVKVYDGKQFNEFLITGEMLGHFLLGDSLAK